MSIGSKGRSLGKLLYTEEGVWSWIDGVNKTLLLFPDSQLLKKDMTAVI